MSTNLPTFKTADICDSHSGHVRVLPPTLLSYGGLSECAGEVVTIRLAENNAILRELFAEQGHGRIVVVDVGEGYFAVVGDNLAGMAIENGWSGIIVNGYVRDTAMLRQMQIAVWAIGTCPRRGVGGATGQNNVTMSIGPVEIRPGDFIYADPDGIVVLDKPIIL